MFSWLKKDIESIIESERDSWRDKGKEKVTVRKGKREIDKCYKGKRNGDKDR